jgi:hypothetical protein
MARPPRFVNLLARPANIAAGPPPIVTISPASRVTAQDIAQFDARWMSAADLKQRLSEYTYGLTNRQVWMAWGVFDDAAAMVRMFELTHDPKYLDHLRKVNHLVLDFRDDHHPGDDFPRFDNPVCLNCRPPLLVDRVRGKVVPAWGSGILYSDYVIDGGLNPVILVISGVYVYGLAAFARLVAEDPDPQRRAAYGADAMKFANATMETMWAFMPDWDTWQAGNYVEGTFVLPHRIPTASQCVEARERAKEHVRQFDREHFEEILKLIDDVKGECERLRDYAGKPLAHNMSAALVMSFIELWRALDSHFYRTSPDRASNAELTRGVIPLVVTRHQRYFHNRLRLKYDHIQGQRYAWNYGDDVPNPHVENMSHANLDMFYIDILWRSFDRLNAQVAPMGEPIPLHDAVLRRFANTFLHIARPAEIDRGGNVRGNVDGDATKPKEGKTDWNNSVLDGWVTLAAVDPTVYRLCRDVLLRTGTREGQPGSFQNYLGAGNHAALLAAKGVNVPSIPLILQPGEYTIQQQSNRRYVDAHEIEAKDFALVTRAAQNNDTQKWVLTPVGGVYTIQQKSNGRFVDAHEIERKDFALVTRTAQNNDTQRWVLTRLGGPYTIQQRSNSRYVDAHDSAENDFALVTRTAQNNDNQRWTVTPSANNTYTIQQKSNGRYVDAHEIEGKDFALVTRTAQNNDSQRWLIKSV